MTGYARLLLSGFLLLSLFCPVWPQTKIATAGELAGLVAPEPDERIAYGERPLQFGNLRLPEGEGPHPVAILIHGGCWLSAYDITHIGALAQALAESGIAVWSLEYRRVGDPGGGWPGTFQDVAKGADFLRQLAQQHPLDLDRVIAMGHSAGGQLALWLAARIRMAPQSPFYEPDPIRLKGVLGLAAAADLAMVHRAGNCDHAVDRLMGGSPGELPERYRWASPTLLTPLQLPQILINGAHDSTWAPSGLSYYEAAKAAGDSVELIQAPDSGHFEMIMPASTTWPIVRDAAWKLLGADSTVPEPSPSISGQVVFLYYRELGPAVHFYEVALGLKKTYDAGWVKIYATAENAFVGLVDEERGFHRTAPKKPVMVSIVTEQVDEWHRRLSRAGIEIVSPLTDSTQSPVRGFIVKDPGGYTVEFFQWQ